MIDGIEFRSATLTAVKSAGTPCLDYGHAVIYRGPFTEGKDDEGHVYPRDERMAVCERTYRSLTEGPYKVLISGSHISDGCQPTHEVSNDKRGNDMRGDNRLQLHLLLLRLSIFLVMLMWTLDKIVRPEHAIKIFEKFYSIGGLGHPFLIILGGLELILLAAFVLGYRKRLSYGLVFLLHGVSTLSSYHQFLTPFESTNLLFFAAWPMLAACFALYRLRDLDTLGVIERR